MTTTVDAVAAPPGPALSASPELPVTVTAQELGVILDLAVNANAPVGLVLKHKDLFARLVKLANQSAPIGAVPPVTLTE